MFKKLINSIPANVRPFLLRAAILVVVWELLYNFVLMPAGIPDDQLTRLVQVGAMKVLSFFYTEVGEDGSKIILNGNDAVSIAIQDALPVHRLAIGHTVQAPPY